MKSFTEEPPFSGKAYFYNVNRLFNQRLISLLFFLPQRGQKR